MYIFSELRPYKYAGYPQLIKTIRLETKDDQLFSKEVPLLTAASELCYHTVHCSALNAEELRREEGIEALLEAYTRCVSILGVDSKPDSLHYQVISNVTRCFEVACNFEKCKEKIITLPQLLSDVCRVVYFKHTLSISLVTNLAANNYNLQCDLVRNGVLWSLLSFCFEYDYTLDESGVDADEKTNSQKVANNLAKMAILACISLAGYQMDLISPDEENGKQKIEKPPPPIPTKPQVKTSYTDNAQNLIQNSRQLTNSTVTNNSSKSPEKEVQNLEESSIVRKENLVNKQWFKVSGQANNVIVKKVLDKLLTIFISNKLSSEHENEILKLLNSNTRNPYYIWDNGTRAQLLDFLEQSRNQCSKETYEDISLIYEEVEGFVYDAHKEELQIGGVFIRIYNEMPTFPIVQPKQFTSELIEYLNQSYHFLTAPKVQSTGILQPSLAKGHPQYNDSNRQPSIQNNKTIDEVLNAYNRSKIRSKIEHNDRLNDEEKAKNYKYDFVDNVNTENHILMVLRALISVIKSNAECEKQCIGHFNTIFGFLTHGYFNQKPQIKALALEVVALVSRHKECVTEIAACEILGRFLIALRDPDMRDDQPRVLETLSGLMNAQEMIKEAQNKGAVIYLLDMFCNSRNPQIRETCADILSKMTADRLSGPKVRITVQKFLPPLFVDAMIESPATSVQLFESVHEHPELNWNVKTRSKVCDAVSEMCDG